MEDVDAWKGRGIYSLGPESPPEATIDAQGVIHWTPPKDKPPGTYDVIVSVRSPIGSRLFTSIRAAGPQPSGRATLTVPENGRLPKL